MLRLPQSSSSISGINRPLNARGVVALMHNVRKAQNALNQVVWVHEFLTIELMVAGRGRGKGEYQYAIQDSFMCDDR